MESDTAGGDPLWDSLAGGRVMLVDQLQAAWFRLMSTASLYRTDGYLTEAATLAACRGRRALVDRFCARPLADRDPLLHRRGDECACLEGEAWREGYEYRIHRFLKRNPSRAENERHRAQSADSRDARLRQAVYDRDGGCCRYCRSGPLAKRGMGRARDRRRALQYDHVDPDRPAGQDGGNYVVACARCNELKGHRTPDEAGMVLLPTPTAEEAAGLLASPEALHDLPPDIPPDPGTGAPQEPVPGLAEGAVDNDNDNAPTTPLTTNTTKNSDVDVGCQGGCHAGCPHDPPADVPAGQDGDNLRAQDCPQRPRQPAGQRPAMPSGGSGSGRGGPPDGSRSVDGLGQGPRGTDFPDVYTRRSRDPPRDPPRSAPRGGDP